MGFSGFFRLHTHGMATGNFAISRALQSKKPKKHPNPPQQAYGTPHGYAHTARDAGCSTIWTIDVNQPAIDMRITPDKKLVIGRNASTGAP
jgi:hypothetical protein